MQNHRFSLRDYQQEAADAIARKGDGKWLIHMATGLGKTVLFSQIERKGKTLLLSHRDELVRQPIKYFDCPVGIEKAGERAGNEEVVSASVQTLSRRLDRFPKDYFHTIITDECQHSAAMTYRSIYDYYNFNRHLGFTATPRRGDEVGLDTIFDEIIYSKDLKWGIENGWLAHIDCLRVDIGYNLSAVATRLGDLAIGELATAMNIEAANQAIAEAYQKYAIGQTLIFAVNVAHAEAIAKAIPGAVALSANSKDRTEAVQSFLTNKIKCLVNCMLFTEGTDFPEVRTVIMARPTQSSVVYTQAVGRGTRKTPTKDRCLLIDCVGNAGRHNLCSAPTLIGLDMSEVERTELVQGDLLFDIPEIVVRESDVPATWIKNAKYVDLWSKKMGFAMHGVDWFKMPDGSLIVQKLKIEPADELHNSRLIYNDAVLDKGNMQKLFDTAYYFLQRHCDDTRALWDKKIIKVWGSGAMSEGQRKLIERRKIKGIDIDSLTKGEASNIITRLKGGKKK